MQPRTVLLLGWLVLFVYAYPAQMTTDSFDQLGEARAGVYTDSHPPAMALVWKLVEWFVAGGFGMLILQSVTFLVGLYATLRHAMSARAAAWVAVALFVFPPVFLPFAVIWKDCLMAGFLMLGTAGLLSPRPGRRLAGLGALALATAVRYNALAATAPIVVLLFAWQPMHWVKRYALAAGAWLAITVAAFAFNRAITDREMHLWNSSLAVYDIVGTLAHLDEDIPDAELERVFEGTGLVVHDKIHQHARQSFDPRNFMAAIQKPDGLWDLPAYGNELVPEPQRDALARAWNDVVTAHLGAYLRYRLDVFAEVMLRPAGVVPRREFRVEGFAYAQHIPLAVSPAQHHMTHWMSTLLKALPIFVPWIYAALAIFVAVAAIVWRLGREVVAFALSGLGIQATLFLLVSAADYRYSHWLVVATCVALAIAIARRARQPLLRAAASTQHSEPSQASAQ